MKKEKTICDNCKHFKDVIIRLKAREGKCEILKSRTWYYGGCKKFKTKNPAR